MWCIPEVDGEYVARMEDVLDLYTETPNPYKPVECLVESPIQLIGETRGPIPAKPGKAARIDYEYRRNGTANLFVFVDAHAPRRHVTVTEHHPALDFAECLRDLVDMHHPNAPLIRVVLDNLSTHRLAALPSIRSGDTCPAGARGHATVGTGAGGARRAGSLCTRRRHWRGAAGREVEARAATINRENQLLEGRHRRIKYDAFEDILDCGGGAAATEHQ